MPDATFDAIIIGAGHNGMALAAYLAKAGWSVGVFEKRTEEGGGLMHRGTDAARLPAQRSRELSHPGRHLPGVRRP